MAIKDLSGEKFGMLTVLEYAGKNEKGYHSWKCKCDCGKIVVKSGKGLRNGHITSCGCRHKAKDLTGMVFGNLKVIKIVGKKNRNTLWLCRCECGKYVECYQYNLERGTSTSCGCLRSYYAKKQDLAMENLRGNFIKSGVP